MTKQQYHEQLESAVTTLRAVLADEKAYQAALNEALERHFAECLAAFDASLARVTAQGQVAL